MLNMRYWDNLLGTAVPGLRGLLCHLHGISHSPWTVQLTARIGFLSFCCCLLLQHQHLDGEADADAQAGLQAQGKLTQSQSVVVCSYLTTPSPGILGVHRANLI